MAKIPTIIRSLTLLLLGAGGFVVALAYAQRLTPVRAVNWPLTFAATKDLLEGAAVVIGGIWSYLLFVRQRLGKVRANLTHEIDCIDVNADYLLLHVITRIKNVGSVVIKPPKADVSVDGMVPLPEDIDAGLDLARTKNRAPKLPLEYPSLGTKTMDLAEAEIFLEPGEEDVFPADFVLSRTVKVVRVVTEVECGPQQQGITWRCESIQRLDSPQDVKK